LLCTSVTGPRGRFELRLQLTFFKSFFILPELPNMEQSSELSGVSQATGGPKVDDGSAASGGGQLRPVDGAKCANAEVDLFSYSPSVENRSADLLFDWFDVKKGLSFDSCLIRANCLRLR
jgi:hypothetical protein